RGLDEDPRARAAVLAGVVENRRRGTGGGALQVRVGEDDVGALAAEFERHALDLLGATGHHLLAHVTRTGETDLTYGLVCDESPTHDTAVTGQYLEDPLGKSSLEAEFGETDRRQWRQRGGFEDDGIAGREGRRESPTGDRHGKVPRHDDAHDAERL